MSQCILITGCSTGIGYDAALTLAKRGHHVVAACRKSADVERLNGLGIESVQMDVASPQSIATGLAQVLEKTKGRLDILINNAGYGQAGALEDINDDLLKDQFATNVFGLMELTRLVIPIMRQQQRGRIINVSSLLGMISLPFRGAYNASKHALEGLSDTLRLELKPSGIHVITMQPGPIKSRFRDTAVEHSLKHIDIENSHFHAQYQNMLSTFRQKKLDSKFTKDTDAVVKKLIHAIESPKPKLKYPITVPTYCFILLKRLLTTKMLDRLLKLISNKELR